MLMKCWGVHMAFESPHILVQSMYDVFSCIWLFCMIKVVINMDFVGYG